MNVTKEHDPSINEAIEIVLAMAVQGAADRLDNPTLYRYQMAAIRVIEETFSKSGELKW